ncbi:unnamed protein product [Meganyctiphanes norvegica]|uniref:Uncharacterized protein n=1 Tax=Meganyctiphanes norvegica TaxID=48144 RepID=A0AAV2PVH1_MEGNR
MEKEKSKRDECKEAKIHTLKGPITVADKDHLLPDKVSSQSDKGQTNHTIEKELTLQAHFAFGTPSNPTIQYANVAPTSSSSGKPVMSKATDGDHWQWGPSDNRGASAGGAQCSITCGREGLTMTYNASADTVTYPSIPCDVCPDGHADNIPPTPTVSRSMMDLHHSTEATVTTGRSQTFSGSLDRHTQRGTQGTGLQRPYGRRCKSTAHIILQNNDVRDPGSRSKDGMHSGGRGEHRGRPLLRGRGRHTERQPPDPPPEPATGEGWERLHNLTENLPHAHHHHHHSHSCPAALPPPPPPCCPCHHCNALYSFVTSMAHDPCHSCQPSHHHHHPSCSCMSHHFHQDPPLPPKTPPTTRTYNSHRSYEEYPTSTRRRERSKAPPPRSRSASPRPPPARRAASPPSRSPSPQHRWGPRITPVLPRRVVPRMGAAATSTAPTGTQHHPGHHHGQVHKCGLHSPTCPLYPSSCAAPVAAC